MNFPVFSQLSRELDLETSSLETASSSAAGLDHGPPAEPLESLSELGRVRMTPDILAAIWPHLTLHGPPWPG
jgi:hypothetical protein